MTGTKVRNDAGKLLGIHKLRFKVGVYRVKWPGHVSLSDIIHVNCVQVQIVSLPQSK